MSHFNLHSNKFWCLILVKNVMKWDFLIYFQTLCFSSACFLCTIVQMVRYRFFGSASALLESQTKKNRHAVHYWRNKRVSFLLFLLPQKSWISERWSTLPLVFSRFFSQIPIRLSLWGPSKYKQTKSGAKDKIFRDFFSTTLTFSTLLSISQSQSWNFKDFVSKANFLECLILNSTWPTLQQKHL